MICVIIPMFGFKEMTNSCVDFVLKNAGVECDILVVDDGSLIPYEDDRPEIDILRLDENSGFTNATNQGILWALKKGYDYVLLMNNDTEAEPDFLKVLLETLESDKSIGIATSARMTMVDGKLKHIENFAMDLVCGYMVVTQKDIDDKPIFVPWVPINSALIPTDVLRYVGLLDKRMRNHCSDNDLCIRMHQLGYKVCLEPRSRIKHFHQVTTKANDVNPRKDQEILLAKISSLIYSQLLEKYPLDAGQKTWGKLTFEAYKKDE